MNAPLRGLTVLLLHAFPLDARMWDETQSELGELAVVAPTLPARVSDRTSPEMRSGAWRQNSNARYPPIETPTGTISPSTRPRTAAAQPGSPPQQHHFDSQVDMQLSTDGGASFRFVRAPAGVDVLVSYRTKWDGTAVYDTETLSLNLQGGDLPPGVMIRESPTRRSEGGTAIEPVAAEEGAGALIASAHDSPLPLAGSS